MLLDTEQNFLNKLQILMPDVSMFKIRWTAHLVTIQGTIF